MNSLVFYNILILALLCVFIPSVYTYMYTTFIGRVIIILLIAYFSKVNFYVALAFITLIIIKSIPIYEGFSCEEKKKK
jgi:hypothetical protein